MSEIIAINFEDVKINDDGIQVHIRQSKTDQAGVGHSFLISPSAKKTGSFCEIIKAYFTKFPESMRTRRFLRKNRKNGFGTNRPTGVNMVATYPNIVSKKLNLEGNFFDGLQ